MTTATRNFDSNAIRTLASAVMDGTATGRQQQQLASLLRDDEAAWDEYLAFVDMHAMLATKLSLTSVVLAANPPQPIRSWSGRRWIQVASVAGLAVCLLIAVTLIATNESDPSSSFSSVAFVSDADGELKVGDRLGAETIHLKSGLVRLVFDDGVEVTLEGPAEFGLIKPGKTRLTTGLLTATVPEGAEGFRVETPTAEVIDLGTSFGVDLREAGYSRVSVFDGEVAVAASDKSKKHLLTEGESVRIGADRQIERVDFDPRPFEKVWPISSGIAGSSDLFRFVPPWPKRIRFVQSDEYVFVAAEGSAVDLGQALQVNISAPGEYRRVDELTPLELPAGERVRSYILHFSPTENLRPQNAQRVAGSITFDRPVLGLIVQHEELLASMRRFSRRGAGEIQQRRQLDLSGRSNGDRITLSEDRKTVTLDLISPGRNTDLVRVIVDGDKL